MVAGHRETQVTHSQLIPNPTPPIPRAHSSLLVNKVTSSFPGIALRKSISHKHTMVTNNVQHGHVWEVPCTCGHMADHTLSQGVHTHCWLM